MFAKWTQIVCIIHFLLILHVCQMDTDCLYYSLFVTFTCLPNGHRLSVLFTFCHFYMCAKWTQIVYIIHFLLILHVCQMDTDCLYYSLFVTFTCLPNGHRLSVLFTFFTLLHVCQMDTDFLYYSLFVDFTCLPNGHRLSVLFTFCHFYMFAKWIQIIFLYYSLFVTFTCLPNGHRLSVLFTFCQFYMFAKWTQIVCIIHFLSLLHVCQMDTDCLYYSLFVTFTCLPNGHRLSVLFTFCHFYMFAKWTQVVLYYSLFVDFTCLPNGHSLSVLFTFCHFYMFAKWTQIVCIIHFLSLLHVCQIDTDCLYYSLFVNFTCLPNGHRLSVLFTFCHFYMFAKWTQVVCITHFLLILHVCQMDTVCLYYSLFVDFTCLPNGHSLSVLFTFCHFYMFAKWTQIVCIIHFLSLLHVCQIDTDCLYYSLFVTFTCLPNGHRLSVLFTFCHFYMFAKWTQIVCITHFLLILHVCQMDTDCLYYSLFVTFTCLPNGHRLSVLFTFC